ncbi:uncharacterized protein LOC128728529 [Anopheles nili]|uniref:uncharacterized protein LOC128728529 n=1 Tax=Anopheles nili TaxID=185578 RepID=UPI00237B03AA|nr:uncharacterized protein LOC128728529 [Anopheles nili]
MKPTVLASRRTILLVSISRYEKFLEDFVAERDQIEVETRLRKFERLCQDLEDIQQGLEDSASTAEEISQNAALRENFESRTIQVQSKLQAHLRLVQTSYAQTTTGSNPLKGIKLPTIALPEFSGDYMQWLTFRDTFECLIHANGDLPAIQKFHYLRAAVKGEAAQVIESITISAANYDLAWNTLTERYSNEYLLKKRHLQAMFAIPAAQKESVASLHHLVDEFERHKKILQHLGEETGTWGSILEHLLCTKLPIITLRDWEEHASSDTNPKYDGLISFLHRRMRVLETLLVNNRQTSQDNDPRNSRRINFPRHASFAATSHDAQKCKLCNSAHHLVKCPRFEGMEPKERRRFAMTAHLCLNCLRENHMARDCPSQYKCRYCNATHHTKLHFTHTNTSYTSPPHQTPDATSDPTAINNTQRTFAAALQQASKQVLLQTALIHIIDEFGIAHPARALLDSASQPNLISDRLAHRLRLKKREVNVTIVGAGQSAKTRSRIIHIPVSGDTSPAHQILPTWCLEGYQQLKC